MYLVTGGAGFIGSHIARRLVSEGQEVRVLDNLSSGNKASLCAGAEFVKGDVCDYKDVMSAIKDVSCVFHCAAQVSVSGSVKDPAITSEINSRGTLNVLDACRRKDAKMVLSSSCAVYGNDPKLPKKEDMLPEPSSPYSVTKLLGEYYCKTFSSIYSMNTISLRYFNVYGPGQNPEYAAVIQAFIDRMKAGRHPVIYGDGKQSRDFVHVDDVARANLLASKLQSRGKVINIGTGKETSVLGLVDKLNALLGKNLQPVFEKERPGDVRHSVADKSLAESLGWSPEIDLETGLKKLIG